MTLSLLRQVYDDIFGVSTTMTRYFRNFNWLYARACAKPTITVGGGTFGCGEGHYPEGGEFPPIDCTNEELTEMT